MEVCRWAGGAGVIGSASLLEVCTRTVVVVVAVAVITTKHRPRFPNTQAMTSSANHSTTPHHLCLRFSSRSSSGNSSHGSHRPPGIQTSAWGCPRPRLPTRTMAVNGDPPGYRQGRVVLTIDTIGNPMPLGGASIAEGHGVAVVEDTILGGSAGAHRTQQIASATNCSALI